MQNNTKYPARTRLPHVPRGVTINQFAVADHESDPPSATALSALRSNAEAHERHQRDELERAAKKARRFVGGSGVAA